MGLNWFRKIFDTSERDVKQLLPAVEKINALEEEMKKLSTEGFRARTEEFKSRLAAGETLDDILYEAFAICREAGRRTLNMRHFDVQLLGGMVLHQGRISEMSTGEGKTLVATLPLYLNSLTGEGVHLVTVNDYLARRDAVWMGPIYHLLGVSVGIIQGQSAESDELGGSYIYEPGFEADDPRYMNLRPCTRKEAYEADITYGTNHEYGFDYLRDNMAFTAEELSQRSLNFAIIDEVDSILIDEARTPHIISGAIQEDVRRYIDSDRVVRRLVKDRDFKVDEKARSASLSEEGVDRVEQGLGIPNLTEDPEVMHYVNASLKAHALFTKDKEYVVKDGEIIIVDENTGRLMFGRRYSDGLHQAIEAKEGVPIRHENQTIAVVTFQNLFRLYKKLAGMTGTAKTEEDEFRKIYGLDVVTIPTNKPRLRKDYPDQVFKTEEAKWRGITMELIRLYGKQQPVLVGTRSIEMSEKLSRRLTAERLQALTAAVKLLEHIENNKSIAKEKKQEYRGLVLKRVDQLSMGQMQQIAKELGLNVKMTDAENLDWLRAKFSLGADSLEYIEEALRHGIPHNILNAKFHEKEALIIAEAGIKGRVTIATNMAGRGVDILLGGTVLPEDLHAQREQLLRLEEEQEKLADEQSASEEGAEAHVFEETFGSYRRGGKQRAAPPLPLDHQQRSVAADEVRKTGGLYILGTERHESRRIDNQLRGRAGRQGDPGETQFFVSMEDELMRLFGDKSNNPLLKTWPEEEPIQAKFLSSMIEKAQKRIEFHNFESRKHVLQYDDVLNVQRELIYNQRRTVLTDEADIPALIYGYIEEVVAERVDLYAPLDVVPAEWDTEGLFNNLNEVFPLNQFAEPEELKGKKRDELTTFLVEAGKSAYDARYDEFGEDQFHEMQRFFVLRATNNKWMEHLAQMDHLREGIGLRGYAQQDPLIAYKKEAHTIFSDTMANLRDEVLLWTFRAQVQAPQPRRMVRIDENSALNSQPAETPAATAAAAATGGSAAPAAAPTRALPEEVDWSKVGRNDPCPCGSGLKFKKCHGK